jgi:formylglycine-generating enzyme required for sulfatase activity
VLRGGGCFNSASYLRSAQDSNSRPEIRNNSHGFRLVFSVRRSSQPSAPDGIGAVGGDGQVTVRWNAVSSATSYHVYYKSSSGVTTSDPHEIITGGENNSYTFTNLTNGTKYYFRVEAWNAAGAGSLSSEASATPQAVSSGDNEQTVASIELVRIPAGTFTMGSSTGGYSDEKPHHQVTISNDFYMGKYEVTQKQWLNVMGNWPATGENCWSGKECFPAFSLGRSDNHAMYYVSWEDITKVDGFLDKLNLEIGCNTSALPTGTNRYHPTNVPANCFRLPTEAEWEYAARAGTTTKYYWGNGDSWADIDPYAWHSGNNTTNGESSGTKAVGRKLPNAWGLYDMIGNVGEWTWNWYGTYSLDSQLNPAGPSTGLHRVIRGQGWFESGAGNIRSAYRYSNSPLNGDFVVGFRLVFSIRQQ